MKERLKKGINIVDFPDEYVCIDIETTGLNYQYDEIIEVAAVCVKSKQIISEFSSLVRPSRSHCLITISSLKELGIDSFDGLTQEMVDRYLSSHLIPEYITNLTGISNDDLISAPSQDDVMRELSLFIGDSILIGHNVNFDINFLYDAFEKIGIMLTNNFIDTMRISKRLYPSMEHHRLIDIALIAGVKQKVQHRALADVYTTIDCYAFMENDIVSTGSIEDFKKYFVDKQKKYSDILEISKIPDGNITEFDNTHPLYNKTVVFTGALSSMPRKNAYKLVANLGGHPEDRITQKTNFLVVGNEEFAASVKNGATNKMKKAEKYKDMGLDICVLSEDTFLEMIQ